MEEQLQALVQRLKVALGERVKAVLLYGSAASGDWEQKKSDLNVLCVLPEIRVEDLRDCEPVFRWWREAGNPPPLLLSADEVRSATDCFAMEFQDMREQRRLLHGTDVIDGLEIDRSFYRAQVERELRAKQIRLRQKGAEALASADRLLKLLTDSISTFCVLGRHALILSGQQPLYKKREIVAALESAMSRRLDACNEILAIRTEGRSGGKNEAQSLFAQYLEETGSLVGFVDGLDR